MPCCWRPVSQRRRIRQLEFRLVHVLALVCCMPVPSLPSHTLARCGVQAAFPAEHRRPPIAGMHEPIHYAERLGPTRGQSVPGACVIHTHLPARGLWVVAERRTRLIAVTDGL